MMQTRGRIESIADGIASVRVAAVSACGSCRSKAGCSSASFGETTQLVQLPAAAQFAPGDEITLQMESAHVAGGALLGYLMPAISVLGGAIAGSILYGSDVAAALGAGIGLVVGLVILRWGGRMLSHRSGPSLCHPSHDSLSGDSA